MRVARLKSNGRVIETQSGRGNHDTLLGNAVAAGFAAEDVEVLEMADAAAAALINEQALERQGFEEKRRAEYPALEEQVAALIRGGKELDEMRARILAVDARHPKPQ